MSVAFLLAALCADAGPLPASPPQSPANPKLELDTRDFQFPSGLRVVMQPDATQPVVGITMVIDHGSISDPVGKEGLAHVVEHMVFRAKHGDLPPVWDLLSQLGCSRNASTSSEWTDYRTACPAHALPLLLRLESARLHDAVVGVTEEELDAEREVIRNELRMRAENGFQAILPYTYAQLYPSDDPRSRSVIGSHETLDGITLQDVRDFAATYYRPENATLAVVGDFDPALAGHLLASNLDLDMLHADLTDAHLRRFPRPDLKRDANPDTPDDWVMWPVNPGTEDPLTMAEHGVRASGDPPPPPKPPKQEEIPRFEAPVANPSLVVAWTVPGGHRGNSFDLEYMPQGPYNTIAGILPRDSRGRYVGENTSFTCSLFEDRGSSILLCHIVPPAWMDRERLAKKILATPSGPEWLNGMIAGWNRNGIIRDELMGLEEAANIGDGRSTRLAHHVHQTGQTDLAAHVIEGIVGYSSEHTAALETRWITRGRGRAVLLDPMPYEARDQAKRFEGTGTWRTLEETVAVANITPKAIYASASALDFQKVHEKTLDNGLRVVIYPHGSIPYVRANLVALGGKATSDPRYSYLASAFVDWGRENADRVGGYWTSSYGSSVQEQGLVGLHANADNVMYLLRKAVHARTFDHQDLGTWARDRKVSLEDDVLRRSYWRDFVVRRALHTDDPTRWWADHRWVDDVKDVDPGAIQRWVDGVWQPSNTTLVITGNIDPVQGMVLAERYFKSWEGPKIPAPAQPAGTPVPEVQQTWVLDEPLWTQSEVTLTCSIARGKLETKAARDLLEEVLDDRIRALRERDGITYGGYANVSHWNNGNNDLTMNVLVQNDGLGKAIETFEAALDEVASGSLTQDTIRAAAWMRAVRTPLSLDTQYSVENALVEVVAERGEWTDLAQYPRSLARGTPEEVTAALGDCKKHRVMTIEGPAATIEPHLKGIDYKVFDWRERGLKVLEGYNGKMANRVRKERAMLSESQ